MMEGFTEHLEANDWKDSAAIVGLIRFFEFSGISYNRTEIFNEALEKTSMLTKESGHID